LLPAYQARFATNGAVPATYDLIWALPEVSKPGGKSNAIRRKYGK
jgi:hypothetical protein